MKPESPLWKGWNNNEPHKGFYVFFIWHTMPIICLTIVCTHSSKKCVDPPMVGLVVVAFSRGRGDMCCVAACVYVYHTHTHIYISVTKEVFWKSVYDSSGNTNPHTNVIYSRMTVCDAEHTHLNYWTEPKKWDTVRVYRTFSHELSRMFLWAKQGWHHVVFSHTSSPTLKTDAGRFLKKEKIKLQLLLLWQRQGRKSKTSS